MTKPACSLLFALGVAACAPQKAVVVEEAPARPAGGKKPAQSPAQENQSPGVRQESGMRVPVERLTGKLPEKRDMTPTVSPATGGGGVSASPPTTGN